VGICVHKARTNDFGNKVNFGCGAHTLLEPSSWRRFGPVYFTTRNLRAFWMLSTKIRPHPAWEPGTASYRGVATEHRSLGECALAS
jgi:hypothetical protein